MTNNSQEVDRRTTNSQEVDGMTNNSQEVDGMTNNSQEVDGMTNNIGWHLPFCFCLSADFTENLACHESFPETHVPCHILRYYNGSMLDCTSLASTQRSRHTRWVS